MKWILSAAVACLVGCGVKCGDGVQVRPDEACDDGNVVDGDTCEADCSLPICQNNIIDPGEACDDGNASDTDDCLATCVLASCGDSFTEVGVEECDDSNQINADACKNDCTANVCGDGVDGGANEECDDGNAADGDACENDCTLPACGNNIADPGEFCLAAPLTLTVGADPFPITVGDLDGDGDLDILTSNQGDGTLGLLRGTGTGSFAAQQVFPGDTPPFATIIGDFDGDGVADIITFPTGTDFVSIAVGDVNNDGNLDFAGTFFDFNVVGVQLGDGAFGFSAPTDFPVNAGPTGIAMGDFNGDGNLDIITANNTSGDLTTLLGDGTGSFVLQNTFLVGFQPPNDGPFSVAVEDFNGDGNLDFVEVDVNNLALTFLGDGTGDFVATDDISPVGTFIATGDVNADGNIDLAFSTANLSQVSEISVAFGDGTGIFGPTQTFAVGDGPASLGLVPPCVNPVPLI